MRVIVGLGNPGARYADTRHNVGFAVVQTLACRWELGFTRPDAGLRQAAGTVAGTRVLLVEPLLYMNLSGAALARLTVPVSAATLLVVHDEIDLDLGSVRVKCGGGTAGHRGLESIAERYSNDFTRVRIGVGRPPAGIDAATHVLAPLGQAEQTVIEAAVARAADAVESILRDGEEQAMNTYNMRLRRQAVAVAIPTGRK